MEPHLQEFGRLRSLWKKDIGLARDNLKLWLYEHPRLSSRDAPAAAAIWDAPAAAAAPAVAKWDAPTAAAAAAAKRMVAAKRMPNTPTTRGLPSESSSSSARGSVGQELPKSSSGAGVRGSASSSSKGAGGQPTPPSGAGVRGSASSSSTGADVREKQKSRSRSARRPQVVLKPRPKPGRTARPKPRAPSPVRAPSPSPPLSPEPPSTPPPNFLANADGFEFRGWCISCNMWRAQCWSRWDWECIKCRNHNYANRTVCKRCRKPRQSGRFEPGSVLDMSAICSSHGCPMRLCFKLRDWLCECGNHNYATKKAFHCCFHCRASYNIAWA